jgi:hypothetical protein
MPVERLASRKHQICSPWEGVLRQSLIRFLFSNHPARTDAAIVSIHAIGPVLLSFEILPQRGDNGL